MHALLIEDEPKIAEFIQKGLTESGYDITVAYDGKTGLQAALQPTYDVLIMDIMLPYVNGLEICSQVRSKGIGTPILMLTALGSVDDTVEGLQRGADDYLAKPFHFKELVARLQSLTRRTGWQPLADNISSFADLQLDHNKKIATRDNRLIPLTVKEYRLLEMLVANPRRVLSRSQIAETVWGQESDAGSNMVDVYINYLRKKLEQNGESRLIQTVIGFGYMLKEQ